MYYQPIDPLTTGLNIASILMLAVSCLYIYVTNKNLEALFTYYFPPTNTSENNESESENTNTQTFYPTFPPTPEHYQQRLKEHHHANNNTTMD